MLFHEVSAKDGSGIKEMLLHINEAIFRVIQSEENA